MKTKKTPSKRSTKDPVKVKEPDETYTLELTKEHLYVINSALELFFRCGMGQFNQLLDIPGNFDKRNDQTSELLDQLHVLITKLAPNAYFGISSSEISDSYRVANDLYQVIRHRISWDKEPKGGYTTNFDKPMKWSHSLPLAKIEKKKT